jgi:WD40 repeat protein
VGLWDNDGNLLRILKAGTAVYVAFSPDGSTLAAGGYEDILVWATNDWHVVAKLSARTKNIYHSDSSASIAYFPDGKTLASASFGVIESSRAPLSTLRLWRVSDGHLLQTVQFDNSNHLIALSPSGHTLAIGGGGNTDMHHVREESI